MRRPMAATAPGPCPRGYTAKIDPEAWSVVDGRLFLNYSKAIQAKWEADRAALVERADRNWPGILAGS